MEKFIRKVVDEVQKLVNDTSLRSIVKQRVKEFESLRSQDSLRWFEELVYCILTANSSAETGLKCIENLKKRGHLFYGTKDDVRKTLEETSHRYPQKRAEYIILARKWMDSLKDNISGFRNVKVAREWLVEKIKGIGWKEGSHFLRNVGFLDVAILDRHVLKVMKEHCLIKEVRSLTKKKYLEYEEILREVSKEVGMLLGELDLYLWYMKTKKILK